MELALNAKDPYNYFLLLRALFRSIGGGSHDLLYQEFLPLLPSLLQGKRFMTLSPCVWTRGDSIYCICIIWLTNSNTGNTYSRFE